MRRLVNSNRFMATIDASTISQQHQQQSTVVAAAAAVVIAAAATTSLVTKTTTMAAAASSLATPSCHTKKNGASSCSSIASSFFGGGGSKHQQEQQQQQQVDSSKTSSRKSSTKEKRWRQKEDERVEKLRLLVSYLRNGSSQQMLVKPVKLEADEIELAQRYKSLPSLCENCLKSVELQQQQQQQQQQPHPIMNPMPNNSNSSNATSGGSVSSCSIMNLNSACFDATTTNGLYHSNHQHQHHNCNNNIDNNHHNQHDCNQNGGSNYSSCSRTPEIIGGWNQSTSISGCSSHKQLNSSESSAGIVINVRRSSEQSECLASASDTDSHHNQQLTSAESDQTGSTYSGSSGSTSNLPTVADLVGQYSTMALATTTTPSTLASSSSATAINNGPSSSSSIALNNGVGGNASSGGSTNGIYHQSSSPRLFYIGDHERREGGSAWTNPPNLASWIDNEVNSLVNDLEAKSQLAKSEKHTKSSKRKWLSSGNSRRSSSGAQST